jgi:hypothetical protein
MKHLFPSVFAIVLAAMIILYWIFTLATGSYPEGNIAITFHVSSEILMAMLCLLGGLLWSSGRPPGRILLLAGFSMMVYSTLNAAGYFAQGGAWVVAAVFIGLMITAGFMLVLVVRAEGIN